MHSYMFCDALGTTPFTCADCVAPDNVLAAALAELHRLVSLCDPACLERNPIQTAEWMAATDEPRGTYCPFAYGYSNYSRLGYAKHQLKASGLVAFGGRRLRSTLGGAGLAISSQTNHPDVCMHYAQFSASSEVQKSIYFLSGGQPGHRDAWSDDAVNAASLNFFRDTLQTLDEARLRGRFPGYMRFQDEGTPIVNRCVRGALKPDVAARSFNRLYRDCFSCSAIN
jgi:multiple sugar transport system substrate-binding protein